MVSVSRRLTAMCGGEAVPSRLSENSCRPFRPQSRFVNSRSTASRPWLLHFGPSGLQLRTAHRLLLTVFLLSAFCLLPTEITPSLTVGLLPLVFSQNEAIQPASQPTPSAAPSPLPSPTPPPNLHQWGAVT